MLVNPSSFFTADNCTFSENRSSSGQGAGINNANSSPTVRDCLFIDNFAEMHGGGMNNTGGSPLVINCTFEANKSNLQGGAIYNRNSTPTFLDCTITENASSLLVPEIPGGGIYSFSDAVATIEGTRVCGNTPGITDALNSSR